MKKIILSLTILILALLNISKTYADDFSDAIVKAKKNLNDAINNGTSKDLLKVRGDFERILQFKKNQWLVDYYLADVDLQLSYLEMKDKNSDNNIKKYTESSIDLLNKSTDLKDDFAEAWILKFAANGSRFVYEPDKMNDILTKLTEAKDKATKLEPDNPRLYLIDGGNLLYTPESFGGGADKAIVVLQKSWDLFQTYKPKDETYPDWGIDRAAGNMALCYLQKDDLPNAKKWIDKGLEVTPDSGFIKYYVQKQYDEKAKK